MAWENPYKSLCDSLPEILFSCTQKNFSDDQRRALNERFKTAKRVIVEGCCGSGEHLVARAAADPESLYVGFEIRFKRAVKTAQKAEKLGLKNLLVLRTVVEQLHDIVGERALDGFFINFPDPWDHRRWIKNRVLSEEFLVGLGKLLRQGGFLSYKTDHSQRFEEVMTLIESMPEYTLAQYTRDLHSGIEKFDSIPTEFERLYISQGRPINYLHAIRG